MIQVENATEEKIPAGSEDAEKTLNQVPPVPASRDSADDDPPFQRFYRDASLSDREDFQRACRRLLKTTFVVRDRDPDSKRLYFFLSRHQEEVSDYLLPLGFETYVDRDMGFAMLRSLEDPSLGKPRTGHLYLRKQESIVLCCLWVLYADRMKSGTLRKTVPVTMGDLRFELEKYGARDLVDKTAMASILALFARFSLLDTTGKIGEEDFTIHLYPSMLFALDSEAFRAFVDTTAERMKEEGDTWENTEADAGDDDEDEEEDLADGLSDEDKNLTLQEVEENE